MVGFVEVWQLPLSSGLKNKSRQGVDKLSSFCIIGRLNGT
jgi:hypothetical protein